MTPEEQTTMMTKAFYLGAQTAMETALFSIETTYGNDMLVERLKTYLKDYKEQT